MAFCDGGRTHNGARVSERAEGSGVGGCTLVEEAATAAELHVAEPEL